MCPVHLESPASLPPWSWPGWSFVSGPVSECSPVTSAPEKHTNKQICFTAAMFLSQSNKAPRKFACSSCAIFLFTSIVVFVFHLSHSPWPTLLQPWSSSSPPTPSYAGEAVGWDLSGSWWRNRGRRLRGWWGSEVRCSRPPPPPYGRPALEPMGPQSEDRVGRNQKEQNNNKHLYASTPATTWGVMFSGLSVLIIIVNTISQERLGGISSSLVQMFSWTQGWTDSILVVKLKGQGHQDLTKAFFASLIGYLKNFSRESFLNLVNLITLTRELSDWIWMVKG